MGNSMKLSVIGILAALLVIECCSGISNPDQIVFPATNVSYAQQIEPYFTLACNTTGCHDEIDQAGGVDLSSWTAIRGYPGLAEPGDTTSLLVKVMFAEELHRAPLNANQNQRDGIRQWIIEGAKNN